MKSESAKNEIEKSTRKQLQTTHDQLNGLFASIARVLSDVSKLPSPVVADLLLTLRTAEKDVSELSSTAKRRVIEILLEHGETTTEKGSRRLEVDGWELKMRPHRTGVDPKKLAALLNEKGLSLKLYMDERVETVHVVSDTKVQKLLKKGLVDEEELKSCQYPENWVVETPHPA